MNFLDMFKQVLDEKVNLRGTKPKDFTKRVKKAAKKIESEHSDSVKKQVKTGMEHAAEFPKETKDKKIDSDYYEELEKLEGKLKKKTNKSFKDIVADMDKEELKENTMASGAGGVFGPNSSGPYAPNDGAIRPVVIGAKTVRRKGKGKRKRKATQMPLTTRAGTKYVVVEAISGNAYYIIRQNGNNIRFTPRLKDMSTVFSSTGAGDLLIHALPNNPQQAIEMFKRITGAKGFGYTATPYKPIQKQQQLPIQQQEPLVVGNPTPFPATSGASSQMELSI